MAKSIDQLLAKAEQDVVTKLQKVTEVELELTNLDEMPDKTRTKPATGVMVRESRKTKNGNFVYLFSDGTGKGKTIFSNEDLGEKVVLRDHRFTQSKAKDGATFVWY